MKLLLHNVEHYKKHDHIVSSKLKSLTSNYGKYLQVLLDDKY